MKLTKAEERIIDKRAKLAEQLFDVCKAVDDLIEEKGCEDDIDESDWLTGCEIYVNPIASAERIKEAIRRK